MSAGSMSGSESQSFSFLAPNLVLVLFSSLNKVPLWSALGPNWSCRLNSSRPRIVLPDKTMCSLPWSEPAARVDTCLTLSDPRKILSMPNSWKNVKKHNSGHVDDYHWQQSFNFLSSYFEVLDQGDDARAEVAGKSGDQLAELLTELFVPEERLQIIRAPRAYQIRRLDSNGFIPTCVGLQNVGRPGEKITCICVIISRAIRKSRFTFWSTPWTGSSRSAG